MDHVVGWWPATIRDPLNVTGIVTLWIDPKDLLGRVIFVTDCSNFAIGGVVDWEVFVDEGEVAVPVTKSFCFVDLSDFSGEAI